MGKFGIIIAMFCMLNVAACERYKPTHEWVGKWNGPEGTFLDLSKNGNGYIVKIQSLDALKTYKGLRAKDGIAFERNGKTETIREGMGPDTGMKWLLEKKECLVIQAGEGFCRD